MEEKFEGPLEIKTEHFGFLIYTVRNFANARNLECDVVHLSEVIVGEKCKNPEYYKGVFVASFLHDGDKLLFFTPFVYPNIHQIVPPNERSLLFPLKAFYKLSQDEQKRVVLALLEAAWKEAKLLDEDDAVELLGKK